MGKGKDGEVGFCIACGTAACLCLTVIIFIGLSVLGIVKIIMGAVYLHDCSIQYLIPIWLIVSGLAPILFGGFGKKNDEEEDEGNNGAKCGIVGFVFNFVWLICGSVWVYPNYSIVTSDHFAPCTGNITTGCIQGDCNKTLISFACAMATIDWIILVLVLVHIGGIIRLGKLK